MDRLYLAFRLSGLSSIQHNSIQLHDPEGCEYIIQWWKDFRNTIAAAGISFYPTKLPMLYMASYQFNKVLSKFLCYLVESGLGRGPTDTYLGHLDNRRHTRKYGCYYLLVHGRHENGLVVLCCM